MFREQALRFWLPVITVAHSVTLYQNSWVKAPAGQSFFPLPLAILFFLAPILASYYALFRRKISLASLLFILHWYLVDLISLPIEGYWCPGIQISLIIQVVLASLLLRTSEIIPFAIFQIVSFVAFGSWLESHWYSVPLLQNGQSLPSFQSLAATLIPQELMVLFVVRFLRTQMEKHLRLQQESIATLRDRMAEGQALEAQLIQAQKMEAVGQLAGGVAHDFNNILMAILMHLNLLQTNEKIDASTKGELDDLETQVQRAVSLARQLLVFSRREVMQRKVFEFNSLLGNLVKMLRRIIGEHINLELSGASHDLWIEADPGMVEQVVMNLLLNARDAMPCGGRISLHTQLVAFGENVRSRNPEALPGQFVRLRVSDTGSGMDANTLKRVFEPFFTTKGPSKGTGLGLATVYGIVKQHEGWVEVESAIGQGSKFSVFLPACGQAPEKHGRPDPGNSLLGGSETLLLVEDDKSVRAIARRTLQQLGYRVLEAGNASEALQIWELHKREVDLLISDMVMPGGTSGLELAEHLSKQKAGLNAIIVSGYSVEPAACGLSKSKGVKLLSKPLSGTRLAQAVRECLDKKSKGA